MGGLNKNSDSDWIKHRYIGAGLCIVFIFGVLFLRLFYLQMIHGEEYRRLSTTNCVRLKSIKSSRGLIYDRNHNLLVDNRPAFDLVIVLEDAKPLKQTLERLAEMTGDSYEDLMATIKKAGRAAFYKPLVLKRDITRDLLAVIEAHQFDLPGIHIDVEPTRNYIHKKTAAHLIGYLGEINKAELASGKFPNVRSGDSIGRYGVEKSFEADLQGKRGGHQVEVDVNGRVIKILKTVEPVSGKDLVLTMDLSLQQKAEGLLGENDGAVVALDPSNGDVLVMASSPSFDQNDFIGGISTEKWQALRDDPGRPMNNKAIQAEYPPASTYKTITALAGLEENVIDRNATFFCPGFYRFGNRRYHCWNRYGHGHLSVVDAIAQSCDVFFYQTGEKIGVDALARYAHGSGLGRLTGIRLAHERPGLIPTSAWKKKRFKERWQAGETLSISIGQGFNLVTPLQMAVFISAVGNNGTLYRPRLVKSVQDAKGQVIREIEPDITGGLPASQKNLAIVRQGLLEVVHGNRGTARRIRLPGIQIAGKTGTAQVFSRKAGEKFDNKKLRRTLQDHAWFVCYAPAQNPRIAIAVIIEHGEHGSSAAAPVAKELIHAYFGDPEVPTAVVKQDQAHVE
ncbi:MAG TPA: penicillin-binding protein 2 [Desulfobacter sp.]|nr:penicillin-binding protein 2 [Desulfobacter sp.]